MYLCSDSNEKRVEICGTRKPLGIEGELRIIKASANISDKTKKTHTQR